MTEWPPLSSTLNSFGMLWNGRVHHRCLSNVISAWANIPQQGCSFLLLQTVCLPLFSLLLQDLDLMRKVLPDLQSQGHTHIANTEPWFKNAKQPGADASVQSIRVYCKGKDPGAAFSPFHPRFLVHSLKCVNMQSAGQTSLVATLIILDRPCKSLTVHP